MKKNTLLKILVLTALIFKTVSTQAISLSVYIDGGDIFCVGGYRVLTASVIGGTPPYSFLWSTSAATPAITATIPGTYSVIVTDGASATATASWTVNFNNANGNLLTLNSMWAFSWFDSTCQNEYTGLVDFLCLPCDINDINFSINSVYATVAPGSMYAHGIEPGSFTATVTSSGCTSNPSTVDIFSPYNPFNINYYTTPSCVNVPGGSLVVTDMILTDTSLANHIFWGELVVRSISSNVVRFVPLNYPFPVYINNLPAASDYSLSVVFDYNCPASAYEQVMLNNIVIGQTTDTCGTISGRVYIDYNYNCVYDALTDSSNSNSVIGFNSTYYASTDTSGQYSIYLPYGNYNVNHSTIYPVFNNCPASSYNLNLNASTPVFNTTDFADTTDGIPDITVYLTASQARVGDTMAYYIQVQNLTITPASNITVTLMYDDTTSYVSSTFTPTVNLPGQLEWVISNMAPFEIQNFTAAFSVPIDTLLTGYPLNASVTISAVASEVNLSNNSDNMVSTIVNSADPNSKEVMPAGIGPEGFITVNDSILKYTIHFQNIGTGAAVNIRIADTLSTYLNPMTFEAGASSHPYTYTMSGEGIIEFVFAGINLPSVIANEQASHGYVSFRINADPNLPLGTVIENTAHNIFDFNAPVSTNTAINTITDFSGIFPDILSNSVSVYPNPSSGIFTVQTNSDSKKEIVVTDLLGNMIDTFEFKISNFEFDLSGHSKGVYLVKLMMDGRTIVKKIVLMP